MNCKIDVVTEEQKCDLRQNELLYLDEHNNIDSNTIVSDIYSVGDKTKIALLLKNHVTIGIDCVANCLNSIVSYGAKPLFFSLNTVFEKSNENILSDLNKGVKYICDKTDTKFLQSNYNEFPEIIKSGTYGVTGFAVGYLNKNKINTSDIVRAGDVIVGLPSEGVHNTGFSLLVKNIRPSYHNINEYIEKFQATLGEEFIKPTKCYVNIILHLLDRIKLKKIINISTFGIEPSINKSLDDKYVCNIDYDSFPNLPVFNFIKGLGNINDDVSQHYNLGIGMAIIASEEDAKQIISILHTINEEGYIIGRIV